MPARPILILLAATALASAQTQTRKSRKPVPATVPANPDAWPIASVSIQGNHFVTKDQVLQIAGLKVGQTVSKQDLDAAHDRLIQSGAFDSVGYKYQPAANGKGVDLSYELLEVNAFFPLMFEELPASDAEIRAYLKSHDALFGPKVSATKEALDHYRKLVSDFLAERNYHEPLTAKLSAENPPDLVILIRPSTPRAVVSLVTAVNTGEIPAGVVQSTAYGVAVGTIYSEPRFRQVLDESIRPLYEAHGRMRVTFPKVSSAPAKDDKGVVVTVEINQGPVYKFGKIEITGADTARLELPAVLRIKTGDVANFDDVKAAQTRIEAAFRHDGYLQARTEPLRTLHDNEKTVDVNIRIDSGPLFTFRNLDIVGLDIISEPQIRKLWGLKAGAPYNPDYPKHFQDRIKEDGLFDNLKSTDWARKLNQLDHTVDVTLYYNVKAPQ